MRARRTDKPSPHDSPTARLRQVAKLITNANRFGGSRKAKSSRQQKGAKPAKSPPCPPSGITSTITDALLPLFVESRLDGTPPLSDLEKELLLDTCKKVNPPPGWSLGAWKSLWVTSAADSLRLLQLHAGDDVYDIGDECDDGMYLCLAGGCTMTMVAPPSAAASSSDRVVETQIEAAWAFGASELQTHAQRRATVTALVDSTFLSIDRDAYMGLVARNCFRVNTRSLGVVTRILARPRSNRGPSEIESLATSLRNLDFFRRMEHDILVSLCERALLVHVEERGGSLIMSPREESE